jgi:hypothetical protein
MFQDLSRIMRNHHDCRLGCHHGYIRITPYVGKHRQTSGHIEADSSRFCQFVTNRGTLGSRLIVAIRGGGGGKPDSLPGAYTKTDKK